MATRQNKWSPYLNAFSKRLHGVLPSRLDNDGNGAGSGLALLAFLNLMALILSLHHKLKWISKTKNQMGCHTGNGEKLSISQA